MPTARSRRSTAPRHGPGHRRRRLRPPPRPGARRAGRGAARRTTHDASGSICSAGVAWSADTKRRLLAHIPEVALVDGCGSTEGGTYGISIVRHGDDLSTATFQPAPGHDRPRESDGAESRTGETGLIAAVTLTTAATTSTPRRPRRPSARSTASPTCPRRLRAHRAGRLDHPPRPRRVDDQHRRGEGLSRGGRGRPQGAAAGGRRDRRGDP